MKYRILSALLIFVGSCFCMNLMAQDRVRQSDGKKSLYVEYFTCSSGISVDLAEGVRNGVLSCISGTKRLFIIDVDAEDALRVEKARRESGDVSAGGDIDRIAVMSKLGANYILQGHINSVTAESKRNDKNRSYYEAKISYSLKVVDANNGTTVTSYMGTLVGGNSSNPGDTPTRESAISAAVSQARYVGTELINETFKLYGTILEINTSKGDEAKDVYISLGTDHGVNSDSWFRVCVVRTIAGRTSKHEIGRLKVTAIEGGDLSLCKVKKGGEQIKRAFDQKQDIEVELIHHMGGLFNGLFN